jgi:hypothetical protein
LTGERLPPERLPIGPAGAKPNAPNLAGAGWLVYLSPRVPRSVLLQEIS